MKFGLRGIRRFMRSLGHPERHYPVIHIAGTNGKGSTAAMLAAVLTAAGYKTGLYTSPHLVDFTERIRINGKPISHRPIVRLTRRIRPLVQKHHITFFETTTAIAFKHFADERVDVAVVETGLGGRLDATNIVKPILTIITSIGKDHTEILGNTLQKIAAEKAGIIKRQVPCIVGEDRPGVRAVFRRVAKGRRAPIVYPRMNIQQVREQSLRGTWFDCRTGERALSNLHVSLPGLHQLKNASLVLSAVDLLRARGRWRIPDKSVRKGLAEVSKLSGFEGRLSVVCRKPIMIADVAHNPLAMKRLVESLKALKIQKPVVMFGLMKDKDSGAMIRVLQGFVSLVVVVRPTTERAKAAHELEQEFCAVGIPVRVGGSVREGLRWIRSNARSKPVLITGSNFVVGEVLALLRGKNYLTINQ